MYELVMYNALQTTHIYFGLSSFYILRGCWEIFKYGLYLWFIYINIAIIYPLYTICITL